MSPLAKQLMAERAIRDSAKATLDANYAQVKTDLEARGIAGRLADDAIEHARIVFDEAVDVAENHPGVIGGTIAALALWLFRDQAIGLLHKIFGGSDEEKD